jgi:hypothetical protein
MSLAHMILRLSAFSILSAHDNARFDRENRKPDIRPNTLDWHAGDGGQPSSQHGCTTANIQNATRECRPDHGVNASTRVGNFYTYMVRREMQATEDRIMERVMAKTDLQVLGQPLLLCL